MGILQLEMIKGRKRPKSTNWSLDSSDLAKWYARKKGNVFLEDVSDEVHLVQKWKYLCVLYEVRWDLI